MDGHVRPFFCGWKFGRNCRPISENRKLDGKMDELREVCFDGHICSHIQRYIHTASYLKWAPSAPAWPILSQVVQKINMNSLEVELAISGPWLRKMLTMTFLRPVWPYPSGEMIIDQVTGVFLPTMSRSNAEKKLDGNIQGGRGPWQMACFFGFVLLCWFAPQIQVDV